MDTFALSCVVIALLGSNVLAVPFDHIWNVKRSPEENAPSQRCRALQYAFETAGDTMADIMTLPAFREEVAEPIHYKPYDRQQWEMTKMFIRPYVCAIADANSLEDIAAAVHAPVEGIRIGYTNVKKRFKSLGMSPSQILVESEVISSTIIRELESVGFPNWPLQVNKEEMVDLMERMAVFFSNNWVKLFLAVPGVYPTEDIDFESVAEGLTEATGSLEAAKSLGGEVFYYFEYTVILTLELFSKNQEFRNLVQKFYQDAGHVLVLGESYGLLDLN